MHPLGYPRIGDDLPLTEIDAMDDRAVTVLQRLGSEGASARERADQDARGSFRRIVSAATSEAHASSTRTPGAPEVGTAVTTGRST